MKTQSIQLDTAPIYLTKHHGIYDMGDWRVANERELREFSNKFWTFNALKIHAIDESEVSSGIFGPAVRVYEAGPRGKVAQAEVNPVRGLPSYTILLLIRD